MGDWTIVIEGQGEHDTDSPNSIENLTKAFIMSLGGKQTVLHATVTKDRKTKI